MILTPQGLSVPAIARGIPGASVVQVLRALVDLGIRPSVRRGAVNLYDDAAAERVRVYLAQTPRAEVPPRLPAFRSIPYCKGR